MNTNQGKFRPTISAIDEVDDRNLKLDDTKQQIEGSETAPLTTNQLKLNIDKNVGVGKDLESQNDRHDNDVQAESPISGGPESVNGFRGSYTAKSSSFCYHYIKLHQFTFIHAYVFCFLFLRKIFLHCSLFNSRSYVVRCPNEIITQKTYYVCNHSMSMCSFVNYHYNDDCILAGSAILS